MRTTGDTSQPFPSFPSLSGLKDAEKVLLRRYRESNEKPPADLVDEIESFIRKVQATGAVLEKECDHQAAEDVLDYWVTRLYRSGRRRQGCVRARHRGGSRRHAHLDRRPEGLLRHRARRTRS